MNKLVSLDFHYSFGFRPVSLKKKNKKPLHYYFVFIFPTSIGTLRASIFFILKKYIYIQTNQRPIVSKGIFSRVNINMYVTIIFFFFLEYVLWTCWLVRVLWPPMWWPLLQGLLHRSMLPSLYARVSAMQSELLLGLLRVPNHALPCPTLPL